MQTPVLFLIFNRPLTTARVFDTIRQARPSRLYVAADGPRKNMRDEQDHCNASRQIATSIDWPCEIKTLFRESNLGCKVAVSSGIDWFFQHEEEGIILEDDILPQNTFFPLCNELLEKYRNSEEIAMISGCNLIANYLTENKSYFFSRSIHIWGWATWKRAWKHYDVTMKDWPNWEKNDGFKKMGNTSYPFRRHWKKAFHETYHGAIDTWDYQWVFTCWKCNFLSIIPNINQTLNIGFGSDASHTAYNVPSYLFDSKPETMSLPLNHPPNISRNKKADKTLETVAYDISYISLIFNILRKTPVLGKTLRILKKILSRHHVHSI